MQKVLFIDLMNMFVRCFSSIRLSNDDGLHVGGVFGTLNSLQSQIKMHSPDIVSVVWEGKGSSERRRRTLKEYKEGRKFRGLNRQFQYSQEDEKESFARQLQLLKGCLDTLPLYQPAVQYLEADDQIAYSCRQLFSKDYEKVIVSTDRDYFQLVDENTQVYRPVKTKENPKGEMISIDWMLDKEKVYPVNYALLKAIVGDKSDNIKGISGVGEATVKKDFPILNYGVVTLENFLSYAEDRVGEKKAKYKKYIESSGLIERNYKLVQLLDIDVSLQSIQALEKCYENKKTKFNSYKLRINLLNENISPNNIDNWVSVFNSVLHEPIKF